MTCLNCGLMVCKKSCTCDMCGRDPEVIAREELFSRICNHTGLSDLEANDLIDDYAHELAEKIRKKQCCEECGPYWDGAADLIDPDVEAK